jgi:hypothetical protein
MLYLALDVQGQSNPGLIRAMSGLCHGLATNQGPCGVLTGGLCLIAYHTGKGHAGEEASDRLPLLLSDFEEWFRQTAGQRFSGISCADIVSDGSPDPQVCGGLLAETYQYVLGLLVENGFDPAAIPGP